MINYTIIATAVLLGYMTTVAASLVMTMGVAAGAPAFAVRNHLVRPPYKFVHESLWFFAVCLGAMVTSTAGMGVAEWKAKLALSAGLVFMLWRNTWEARQRGTAHQILISILSIAGVWLGYALQKRL